MAVRLAFFDWTWPIDTLEMMVGLVTDMQGGKFKDARFAILGGQRISDAPAMAAGVSTLEVLGATCKDGTVAALRRIALLNDLLLAIRDDTIVKLLPLLDNSVPDTTARRDDRRKLLVQLRLQCQRAHRRYKVGEKESEGQKLLKTIHHRGVRIVGNIKQGRSNGINSLVNIR